MAWFHCQFCDLLRELSDEHVGKPAKCPKCGKRGKVDAGHTPELPTIGKLVNDDGHEQTADSSSVSGDMNTFWNTMVAPAGVSHAQSANNAAIAEVEDIDDWQTDRPSSSPPPRPTRSDAANETAATNRESLLERARNWAGQGTSGRVFETYHAVRYLRWSWMIGRVLLAVVWGAGTVGIALNGLETAWHHAVHVSAKNGALFPIAFGFDLVLLILVAGLFTLVAILLLWWFRVVIETIAVFFDMAHDLRRLADTMPRVERTPDNC
jgi:uncharacterized membrane protein YvlD (DUF360 family)